MKRAFDLICSLILFILLLPLMVFISLIIVLDSPGGPIFNQKRVGQNTEPFIIYKFRTMVENTPDVPTNDMDDRENYITGIGKFLRKTSLDELPQLLNIIKGEMSFVGPRPPLYSQKKLVKKRKQTGVDTLKPGVTGWAQINGRDTMDDAEKFEYDLYYYKNQSFFFDIKILFLTVFQVLKGEGVIETESNEEKKVEYRS